MVRVGEGCGVMEIVLIACSESRLRKWGLMGACRVLVDCRGWGTGYNLERGHCNQLKE